LHFGWLSQGLDGGRTAGRLGRRISGKRYGDDLFLAGKRRIVTEDTHHSIDPQRKAPPWKS